ncbi:hypothetical protein [Pseudomonas sp. GXZC]|uniref:hypothetical protein n=1 Tax=Pseudomonas sp. GXZC TaxID=3003351 RepID=UPI0022AB1C2C|nr:hypothetical protein [Pseudomonas sp. GXZC]WAT28254.1 hypothetical protein OZ428_30630 [Pseudomonas sp. GXZC]
MTRYLCTIGTTNGSQNVIDDFVEANSEAEAIGEMKKKYPEANRTIYCRLAGLELTDQNKPRPDYPAPDGSNRPLKNR